MSLPASEHAEVEGGAAEEDAGWTPGLGDEAEAERVEAGRLGSLALAEDTTALQSELLEGEVARARRYLEDARAPATRRGYASDERVFRAWCAARDLPALPATPAVVAVFLSAMAAGDPEADPPRPPKKVSTLSRYLAAINGLHRRSGLRTPGEQDGGHQLRDIFLGIRNRHSVRPDQKTALTADRLRALLAATPGEDVRAVRDRALLAFGMTSALRRSEIVALQVADVAIVPEGLRVFIARSKTDQERRGATIAIPDGTRIRPKALLLDWLKLGRVHDGPLFRTLAAVRVKDPAAPAEAPRWHRSDRVLDKPMNDRAVALVVKARAAAAGLDPVEFAAHSLRSGFLTEAARKPGANLFKMREVSRHKSLDVLAGYVQSHDLFRDHAGEGFI